MKTYHEVYRKIGRSVNVFSYLSSI